MNVVFLLPALISAQLVCAVDSWTAPPPQVQLISDEFSSAVPPGYVMIEGHVKEFTGNYAIEGATITNAAQSPVFLTDSAGFFRAVFPVSDSAVYCFKRNQTNEAIFRHSFKSRHLVIVNFNLVETEGSVVPITIDRPAFTYKPVIYAYDAPADVSLRLNTIGSLTYTYPQINEQNEWHFSTSQNGMITDLNCNKSYPYLFWEGIGKNIDFITTGNTVEGYLIKTDTCAGFLENILFAYGLTSRESSDFITFWGPRMIQEEYAFVQFLSTEQYAEKIATADIVPAPESLLRLYMYFTLLDEAIVDFARADPQIPSFSRTGFTVVEWGGSEISASRLFN